MRKTRNIEEILMGNGYEGSVVLKNYGYEPAVIGVAHTGQVIYDYDLMVDYLVNDEGFTTEEAVEWIDYNTIGALGSFESDKPLVMYHLYE